VMEAARWRASCASASRRNVHPAAAEREWPCALPAWITAAWQRRGAPWPPLPRAGLSRPVRCATPLTAVPARRARRRAGGGRRQPLRRRHRQRHH
jgi:hypothetical protein